jgi:uncharacterized protein
MNKKLISALLLNFTLSWGLALTFKLAGVSYSSNNVILIGVPYMLIPALSIFILSKFIWKTPLKTWGIRKPQGKSLFIAWLFPFLFALLTLGISLLFPGVKFQSQLPSTPFSPPVLILILIAQSIVAGLTVNALAAFGEEYFWRGFLLKQLKQFGWLKSSLIIGFIWGLWHAPLILQGHNYPNHPVAGVFMMIVWCILLSFSMIYFTLRTKSVFTAAFFHGILNATAGFAILLISPRHDLLLGATGLSGFIALLILNIFLYLFDKQSSRRIDSLLDDY